MKNLKTIAIVIFIILVGYAVFRSKNNTEPVTVTDNNELTQKYESSEHGFSIRYPQGFTVDEKYNYQGFGPGKDIPGVKFMIPQDMATGTNLGSDTHLSVEQISNAKNCGAGSFLDLGNGEKVTILEENGITYSVASLSGAGAGNRYEEKVYAIPGTNPCMAVRYFIHYSVIENYPPGTVKAFDEAALTSTFDKIRKTLVINQ